MELEQGGSHAAQQEPGATQAPAKKDIEAVIETGTKRLTLQDAEKATQEKDAMFTALMDTMEESAKTQGQYFIRLGSKIPIMTTEPRMFKLGTKDVQVGTDDQRVLLLKSFKDHGKTTQTPDIYEYTMVCRDGIKTLTLDGKKDINSELKIIHGLLGGAEPAEDSGFLRNNKGGPDVISLGFVETKDNQPMVRRMNFAIGTYGNVKSFTDVEEFKRRVEESISKTESPHRQRVEEATKQKQVAMGASEIIRSLPPR